MLEGLQASRLAHAIGESQMLTASLSALHLVGFTLVMGSAMVSNLRLLGALLPERQATDVTDPASRVMLIGLLLSAATGVLLFLPRAAGAAANPIFQVKLSLLVVAALLHVGLVRPVARRTGAARLTARLVGAAGLSAWIGVALAGCAFILFE